MTRDKKHDIYESRDRLTAVNSVYFIDNFKLYCLAITVCRLVSGACKLVIYLDPRNIREYY